MFYSQYMPISHTGAYDRWGLNYMSMNVITDGVFDIEACKWHLALCDGEAFWKGVSEKMGGWMGNYGSGNRGRRWKGCVKK